jgi:hypothetical protein
MMIMFFTELTMPPAPDPQLTELERLELESVVAAFARTPRLAKLLAFIGEKYFQNGLEEITEYNIATQVFGRPRQTFDASRDAIARVEAYRLRKKLKEFYASEGKDHSILVTLPTGSYVPIFRHTNQPAPLPAPAADAAKPVQDNLPDVVDANKITAVQNLPESIPTPPQTPVHTIAFAEKRRLTLFAACAILLLCAGFACVALWHRMHSASDANTAIHESVLPPNVAHLPLRLLAGYNGPSRIDNAGFYWEADQYFQGGAGYQRPDSTVLRSSNPMLFEHWRTGDFSYDIPVPPGPYELHLYFVASQLSEDNLSTFHIFCNGKILLQAFDISFDAVGANAADERVFKDIYPDKDGFLHLRFSMERASPSLNALELLPGVSHKQLPVRIVTQRTAVTDSHGNLWLPDNYFLGGRISDQPHQVGGTDDPKLYAYERYGNFNYSIPVDTHGRYTLILHFAEMFWGQQVSGYGGKGSRVFNVYCNGSTLLDKFDIYKEAGTLHAVTRSFPHLRPSPQGKLNISFEPITNAASISALEVIDESE